MMGLRGDRGKQILDLRILTRDLRLIVLPINQKSRLKNHESQINLIRFVIVDSKLEI